MSNDRIKLLRKLAGAGSKSPPPGNGPPYPNPDQHPGRFRKVSPVPQARQEMERLSTRDLKFIVRRWRDIDPESGVYTFPEQGVAGDGSEHFGNDSALKRLGASGAVREMTPEQIRDMARDILR